MSKKNGAGKFVLGAAIGAIAGVLLAPKSGKENRRIVKEKANELLEKAKEIDVNEVKETIEQKVEEIMNELKDLDSEKALSIAKEKPKDLKNKTDELVKYTKKKATPVLEEAADSLREKAIDATKKVLEKLEEGNK